MWLFVCRSVFIKIKYEERFYIVGKRLKFWFRQLYEFINFVIKIYIYDYYIFFVYVIFLKIFIFVNLENFKNCILLILARVQGKGWGRSVNCNSYLEE